MSSAEREILVGVISDTHGLVRPEALAALQGVELLIHAGDVGSPRVLAELEAVAPVRAVCGNMDGPPLAEQLPRTDVVQVGAVQLYLLHDPWQLDLDPAAAGFAAVITGHTHRPHLETRDGVLHLNPGSAGPPRSAPPSVALLTVRGDQLSAEVVELPE